jgi:hypothetical protein
LWAAIKEAAIADSPAEALRAIRDDIVDEAKKEIEDEKASRSILTEGEAKPRLDSNGKA